MQHDTATLAGALAAAGCPFRIDEGSGVLIAHATEASYAILRGFQPELRRTIPALCLEGSPAAPRIVEAFAVKGYAAPDPLAPTFAVEVDPRGACQCPSCQNGTTGHRPR